jgi:hypothetical protein
MNKNIEFIDIEAIAGKTLMGDGTITLDTHDPSAKERVLRFKPSTHIHLLQALLPRGTAMSGHPQRAFEAEQTEVLQSPRGNLGIRFLLSGGLAMTVELAPQMLLDLRELLNSIQVLDQSLQ